MKVWVIFFLIILLPSAYAVEISINELFEVEKTFEINPEKEVYFYGGDNLIATSNIDLEYNYEGRLGSDIQSKNLPFGEPINIENRFSFTGKELDNELYYFSARYYDSNLGRFVSTDPIEENHPYSYVNNNPLKLVDPDGKRVKVYGNEEDRAIIQRDLDVMVGVGNTFIEETDKGYFISIVNNYQGEFPQTFTLLKEVVEHPTTILLRVTGDNPKSHVQIVERSQTIPIGEDNPIKATDDSKFINLGNLDMFVEDEVTRESVQNLFEREVKYIITQTSRSGMPEVYYSGKSAKDDRFKLEYSSYEILAHELLGHALSYLKGEDYWDIHFQYVTEGPNAAGPGVYAQNVVRQEHGQKIRPAY